MVKRSHEADIFEFSTEEEFLDEIDKRVGWLNSEIKITFNDDHKMCSIYSNIKLNLFADIPYKLQKPIRQGFSISQETLDALESIAKEAEDTLDGFNLDESNLDRFTEPFFETLERHMWTTE